MQFVDEGLEIHALARDFVNLSHPFRSRGLPNGLSEGVVVGKGWYDVFGRCRLQVPLGLLSSRVAASLQSVPVLVSSPSRLALQRRRQAHSRQPRLAGWYLRVDGRLRTLLERGLSLRVWRLMAAKKDGESAVETFFKVSCPNKGRETGNGATYMQTRFKVSGLKQSGLQARGRPC